MADPHLHIARRDNVQVQLVQLALIAVYMQQYTFALQHSFF